MLSNDTANSSKSQSVEKWTVCRHGCGTALQYRTNSIKSCEDCLKVVRREQWRKAAENGRRRRGVHQAKGAVTSCCDCGAPIVAANVTHRRCSDCRIEEARRLARIASEARRDNRGAKDRYNAWAREYRRNNPQKRLCQHLSTLMNRGLASGKQGKSWRVLVPYSLDELAAHLERQFLPGMTWANKGKWHIDHVRPLASFNFTSPQDADFQAAWALSNLRPLWGRDNIRKNARRTHLL